MEFIKGADLSTLLELEKCGARYFDGGEEKEILSILKGYGFNSVRLRLWNDPYDKEGKPYGAGTNDLDVTIKTAKKVVDAGFGFLFNLHYSDFWADPGKQIKPKAWENYSVEELEQAVFDFTKDSMEALHKAGAKPTMVQVGNELSNGLLWPEGRKPGWDNITRFVNAGIRGVRVVDKSVPIMIHLDNGEIMGFTGTGLTIILKRGRIFRLLDYPIILSGMEI